MKIIATILFYLIGLFQIFSQDGYWQQKIDYNINVDFDHLNHQFDMDQQIVYHNNSPETLSKVYMHLYYNAFQPGSMMDVRSRTI